LSICRAGVWEDNDPSLSVNCYNDPAQAARDRVTTTTTAPQSTVVPEEDIIDQVFDGDSTTFPSLKRSECVYCAGFVRQHRRKKMPLSFT
jgi:hypothetical protein